MKHCHTLIIGAGILGLTLAKRLIEKGHKDILIIDKESDVAKHASGRNSGVLHAGIYYGADSFKAKFCLSGNHQMQAYCREHNLALKNTGKVIVTHNQSELDTLFELEKRARQNGARVDLVDEKELADIEPNAKTEKFALYSYYTAVVDPKEICAHLKQSLLNSGKVCFQFNCKFLSNTKNIVTTQQGKIEYQYLINVAGAYADIVAKQFGIGETLIMLPFKGIYRKLQPAYTHLINGNIYPVPNIKNPFLGVHFTKNIHGEVYLGPTAIPALGRENYQKFQGVNKELLAILGHSAQLFLTNPKFRQVALTEPKKYLATYFFNDAKKLVKQLEPHWIQPANKAGIRPQLVDWQTKELVMDFLFEQTENSLHVLNAISPAFTSSMALADYLIKPLTIFSAPDESSKTIVSHL